MNDRGVSSLAVLLVSSALALGGLVGASFAGTAQPAAVKISRTAASAHVAARQDDRDNQRCDGDTDADDTSCTTTTTTEPPPAAPATPTPITRWPT
jgi:hypothetical protein